MKKVPKPTKIYLGAEAFDMMKEALEFYQKHQWQPIETVPNNEEWVLVHGFWYSEGDYNGITLGTYLPSEEMWTFEGGWMNRPTHWMPLPEPPKQ
jgi:hypothetical protein